MGKVLLVDDDAATRLAASKILREAGHTVVTANDGRECLNLYRTSAADVVIMDLYMPNKDGLETLLELRREFPPRFSHRDVGSSGYEPDAQSGSRVGSGASPHEAIRGGYAAGRRG